MALKPYPIVGELAGFLQRGSTASVAVVDATGVPDLCRGIACLVDPEGRRVRVVAGRRPAGPVLARIEAGATRIALVCCRPTSLRTIQVKGVDARVQPLDEGDHGQVALAHAALLGELVSAGYESGLLAEVFDYQPVDLVAISFVPTAVFDQTPGPRAGEPLEAAR